MNEKDKHHASVRSQYLNSQMNFLQNLQDFLFNYLKIVIPFKNYEKVEIIVDSSRSLKENLFRNSLKVFQEITERMERNEKLEFFMKVVENLSISYPNLAMFVERLVDEGIEKLIEVFFYSLSSFLSQYYRGLFFEKHRPHVSERFYFDLLESGESNLTLTEKIRNIPDSPIIAFKKITDAEEKEIFRERLNFTGFFHSDIYCEDCIIYIASFYQSIYEADILLDISKKFPFAIYLFFRGKKLFINVADSLYKTIQPKKVQKGRITLFSQLKPSESAIVQIGSIIKLDNFNEFLIKSINFEFKTVQVKYLCGYFKSRLISFNISQSYNSKNPELPLSRTKSSEITLKFEYLSESLFLINESDYSILGVSISNPTQSQEFNDSISISLDDNSENLFILEFLK
jgi:hypothetical protein